MVLRYHNSDYAQLPAEEDVRAAMRKASVGPGNYQFPYASSMADLGKPEMLAKFGQGPVGLLTIIPSGPPTMGRRLILWFIYTLVIGSLVAYVTGRTLGPDTPYLQVFRVAGAVAFLGYAGAEPVEAIMKGRKWSTTVKYVFDGLIYALLTAGVFGWLWPR